MNTQIIIHVPVLVYCTGTWYVHRNSKTVINDHAPSITEDETGDTKRHFTRREKYVIVVGNVMFILYVLVVFIDLYWLWPYFGSNCRSKVSC
jgi:uncharacterized ion transporter superfamily protein YfcC